MATTCQAAAVVIMVALSVVVASALAGRANHLPIGASHVVRGTVSCVNCDDNAARHQHHLSGIMVSVKCGGEKLGTVATTKEDGSFETRTTSSHSHPAESGGCHAKILGGAHQLYVPKEETSGAVAKTTVDAAAGHGGSHVYTMAEPLRFYTRCPNKKCKAAAAGSEFGSAKTIDLPVPSEWGLAPAAYYLPFVPIIGIP